MKIGDIVLVKFPFANLSQAKKRPALVLSQVSLSRSEKLVTIAMVTSQVDALEIDGDVLLSDWKKCGLLHPSRLRLSKVATVDDELICMRLGSISDADRVKVQRAFHELYRVWF